MTRLFITILGSSVTGFALPFAWASLAAGPTGNGIQWVLICILGLLTVIQNLKTLREKELRGEKA